MGLISSVVAISYHLFIEYFRIDIDILLCKKVYFTITNRKGDECRYDIEDGYLERI